VSFIERGERIVELIRYFIFVNFNHLKFVASATEVEGLIETISTSGVDPGCSERHQVTGPMLPTHQLLTEVGEDG
jgi:hypothetical protein